MKVSKIMTENPAFATTTTSLQETARMMLDSDCGSIPVVENENNKKVIGTITDRDITVRTVAVGKNPMEMTTGEVMTTQVITVTPDSSVEECRRKMENNQIRRIIVVDENNSVVGMVAQADVAIHTDDQTTGNVVEEISKSTSSS